MNLTPSHTFPDEYFELHQKAETYTLIMTFTTLVTGLIAVMISTLAMVSISIYRGVTADVMLLSRLALADILFGLFLRVFFSRKIRAFETSRDLLLT